MRTNHNGPPRGYIPPMGRAASGSIFHGVRLFCNERRRARGACISCSSKFLILKSFVASLGQSSKRMQCTLGVRSNLQGRRKSKTRATATAFTNATHHSYKDCAVHLNVFSSSEVYQLDRLGFLEFNGKGNVGRCVSTLHLRCSYNPRRRHPFSTLSLSNQT